MLGFKFVAAKTDGLGSRLKSLLIAIHLAQEFGADFAFRWQPKLGKYGKDFHSVETATALFAEPFLARHLIGEPDFVASSYYKLDGKQALTRSFFSEVANGGKMGAIVDAISPRQALLEQNRQNFTDAFRAVQFSKPISDALTAAEEADLPESAVAIHVRGGDIVYGPFKQFIKFQQKAVPLPIIRHFVKRLLRERRTPVLFMQDIGDKAFVADLPGVLFCDELVDAEFKSNSARAMYDIGLMARCSQIFSGDSRFSELASMLSGQELLDINRIYGDEEAFAIIDAELELTSRYSPEHVAFARLSQLISKVQIDGQRREQLLEEARSADPKNGLYTLLSVCLLIEEGKCESAELRARDGIATFDGGGARVRESFSEVLPSSPFLHAFLRQAYSKKAIAAHLGPLLHGEVSEFPVLRVLRGYLREITERDAEGARVAHSGNLDVPGLTSVVAYLARVRGGS